MKLSFLREEFKLIFSVSRIGRVRYLSFSTFIIAASCLFFALAVLIDILLTGEQAISFFSIIFGSLIIFLLGIFFLAGIFFHLLLGIRRLHDMNLRGWWLFIGFVPLLGMILPIILYILPGNCDENRFGKPASKNNGWTHMIFVGSLLVIFISTALLLNIESEMIRPRLMRTHEPHQVQVMAKDHLKSLISKQVTKNQAEN